MDKKFEYQNKKDNNVQVNYFNINNSYNNYCDNNYDNLFFTKSFELKDEKTKQSEEIKINSLKNFFPDINYLDLKFYPVDSYNPTYYKHESSGMLYLYYPKEIKWEIKENQIKELLEDNSSAGIIDILARENNRRNKL